MKKILICVLLLTAMLVCTLPVHAAEAEITVEVLASDTEVELGDTVEYTVLATGSGVTAMQFQLMLPEGLSYVPNSGATPENLAQKLGVPAADWTEQSLMFTFYNDIGITFAKGTEIVRFSCVAEKEGTWQVNLYELLPFDGDFNEFAPVLQVQSVQVGEKPPVSGETEQPSEPVDVTVSPETTGQDNEITEPDQTTDPDQTTEPDQTTDPTVSEREPTVPSEEKEVLTTGEIPAKATEPSKSEKPEQESPRPMPWIWIVLGGAAAAAAAVVAVLLIKKKCT